MLIRNFLKLNDVHGTEIVIRADKTVGMRSNPPHNAQALRMEWVLDIPFPQGKRSFWYEKRSDLIEDHERIYHFFARFGMVSDPNAKYDDVVPY